MEITQSKFYRAMFKNSYGSYLWSYGDTIDEIKKIIDEANEKAVNLGYNSDVFIITLIECNNYKDKNENFIKRETFETAIEEYPKIQD